MNAAAGIGVPARTAAVKREKAGISKKNGSSTSPAKKLTPDEGSAVTNIGGGAALSDGLLAGALNSKTFVAPCVIRTVATWPEAVVVRGVKVISMFASATASPVPSIRKR